MSGHIAWARRADQPRGDTMRTFMISIAAFAALSAFVGMPSAVTALTEPQFAAPTANAHQQFRLKDAVRIARPIHVPMFAS